MVETPFRKYFFPDENTSVEENYLPMHNNKHGQVAWRLQHITKSIIFWTESQSD